MFDKIKKDIASIKKRDPAARTTAEVLFLYPGLHAIIYHRAAHWLHARKHYFLARAVSQYARFKTGVEIHPAAKIGTGVFIDHGMGVVIGETAEVGDNCIIYQGVTLGGTGKDIGKRHPTLGSGVMVGSGAKVLGPLNIGDNVKIAAGAVVLTSVPDGATAVGVPARIIGTGYKKETEMLDQLHIPDPTAQELCRLRAKLMQLEAKLEEMTKAKED